MSKIFISLLIVFGIYSYQGNVDDADLRFVILTWKPGQDTSTEISINFRINDKTEIGKIYYDTRPGDGTPSSYSYSREATSKKFKGLTGNVIQYVELSNLTPGVPYYFIVVDETGEYAKDAENISFVSGGDMGDSDKTIEMMAQAGKLSPDIAIVGGDIAYANGKFDSWERWNRWLKGWKEKMVTPDGFSIPVMAAIGNHETNKWPGPIHAKAPYYYYIFGYGDSTYFYKKFGKNLNLIFLDTGHINSYKGDQLEWMEEQLQELKDERLKVAVYHVPLYPSHGKTKYKAILDKYFEYPKDIFEDLTKLKDKIKSVKDLKRFGADLWPRTKMIGLCMLEMEPGGRAEEKLGQGGI